MLSMVTSDIIDKECCRCVFVFCAMGKDYAFPVR